MRRTVMKQQTILRDNVYDETAVDDITDSIPTIRWQGDGQLLVRENDRDVAVKAFQCFPWSGPGTFISLRDADEEEVVLIESLDELDGESREAVEHALVGAGFVMEIQAIESIEENFEIRNWKVKTLQGARKFQTLLDDKLREVPGGGLLAEDVSGDLFFIKNYEALDQKSKKRLWAFLD
jgi:hypothetical protein